MADIQVRSTHRHTRRHAVNCDGMHWCDYTHTKSCKCGRWQVAEGRGQGACHVYGPQAKVGSVSVSVQVSLVVAAAASISLFCSAAVHQLRHKADAFITLLLRNFSCFPFVPHPAPLSISRSPPFNWKIGTLRRLACKASIFMLFFYCSFSFLPSLFISFFVPPLDVFFAFCLSLLLLPLSVGHAPATLHWPWSSTGHTVFLFALSQPTTRSLVCLWACHTAPQISFIFGIPCRKRRIDCLVLFTGRNIARKWRGAIYKRKPLLIKKTV